MNRTWILKIAPVLLLVVQTTTYVLLVRYTLKDGQKTYIQSSVVFTTETLKACIALFFLFKEKRGLKTWIRCIKLDVLDLPSLAEMSGLSLLFTVQNNLGYFAIGSLEAGLFQVMSQLKIMTMALFVSLILKKKLFLMQWFSLVFLTCGVCLMNFRPDYPANSVAHKDVNNRERIGGAIAVLLSALCSGFGCVYNEKILTRRSKEFWVLNAQMYISGSVISLCISLIKDGRRILQDGYFAGFNSHVICIAILSSIGGLIISFVLKTSGNIAKSFGSSFSVIATIILSHYYFYETINHFNFVGIVFVVIAMPMFVLSGK